MSFKNTKKKWILNFMIYPCKEKRGWYTAVCLELALVREGQDFKELITQINKLALNYVRSVAKNNLSNDLLNQRLPEKYIKKYNQIIEAQKAEALRKKWEKKLLTETHAWQTPINCSSM